MKKLAYVGMFVLGIVCFSSSVFAADLKPGDQTSCNNANAITLSANSPADATIWKSANFTTIPVTFGAGDEHSLPGGREVGMADKASAGRTSVKFSKQENFSRGDSVGDISGEVKITNTGHGAISVKCE